MFKSFLIFLWLFVLILFWVYLFSSPQENTQLNARYTEFLSWAIARNTPPLSVVFETQDFVQPEEISNEDFIKQLETEQNTKPELLSFEKKDQNENNAQNGNFWTPNTQGSAANWASSTSSSCNGWLIFDPCIVISGTIPASWGMNFGSRRGS